jgi:hypothetical protein
MALRRCWLLFSAETSFYARAQLTLNKLRTYAFLMSSYVKEALF